LVNCVFGSITTFNNKHYIALNEMAYRDKCDHSKLVTKASTVAIKPTKPTNQ